MIPSTSCDNFPYPPSFASHPLLNLPTASMTSILSVRRSSQGRAVNAYGLLVSAPTGHKSITLPLSSDLNIFSTYVPIWDGGYDRDEANHNIIFLPTFIEALKSNLLHNCVLKLSSSSSFPLWSKKTHVLKTYLHNSTSATGTQVFNTGNFIAKPDTTCAVNTSCHYCLYQRTDILVSHRSKNTGVASRLS